jgi:translation initiation factor IF-1
MVSVPKIIGVISCGVVLSLSLANATQARIGPDPCANRKGGQPNLTMCDAETRQGIETVKGEVLYVDGNDYQVQRYDGKEMRLHTDQTTQMSGRIDRGDRIEVKVIEVDHQIHVLSLRQIQ